MANEILDVGRLAAVARTRLLDTEPDEPFDRLARLAAALLDTPFAFVTLVDDTRSFWKRPIVDDAAHDPRTADNPTVLTIGVAAWAGFPLLAPTGEVLGSFCVADMR